MDNLAYVMSQTIAVKAFLIGFLALLSVFYFFKAFYIVLINSEDQRGGSGKSFRYFITGVVAGGASLIASIVMETFFQGPGTSRGLLSYVEGSKSNNWEVQIWDSAFGLLFIIGLYTLIVSIAKLSKDKSEKAQGDTDKKAILMFVFSVLLMHAETVLEVLKKTINYQ